MRLYSPCDLIFFFPENHFSVVLRVLSHTLHASEMFSSVPTAKQEDESPKLLTKHSILVIAEFELYHQCWARYFKKVISYS